MQDLTAKVRDAESTHLNKYIVEIVFRDWVFGTQPKSEAVMENYLRTKYERLERERLFQEYKKAMPEDKAKARAKEEASANVADRVRVLVESHMERMAKIGGAEVLPGDAAEDDADTMWTGFFEDDLGPWMGVYQINACLRDILSTTGMTTSRRGSLQTFQHLKGIYACDADGVVYPGAKGVRLHFYRDGIVVPSVDDFYEMTGHVRTAQGPKDVVKRHDYVKGAKLRFLITVAARCDYRGDAALTDEDVAVLVMHAQSNGLGACRSMQGMTGLFEVTSLRKITDNPIRIEKKKEKKKPDDE